MDKKKKPSIGIKTLAPATNDGTNNNKPSLTLEKTKNSTITVNSKARNKSEEAINDLRQRIPDIESIFDLHSRIGNGTFSTVILATLKKDRDSPDNQRKKFAIKHHIPTSHPDRIIKELRCMVEIGGSENVVGIECTIRHNESVAFVMPYMQHDRFHDFFSKMNLEEVQLYMRNLLIALRHVHKFNVIHRDIKPSNFLYNRKRRQFLLVDFGLAQQVPQPTIKAINIETKRLRDDDECKTSNALSIESDAKRLRCLQNTSRKLSTDNSLSSTPFKMPLKQINEISTPTTRNPQNDTISTLSGHVKSAVLATTMTNRLHQKLRKSHGKSSQIETINKNHNINTNDATTIPNNNLCRPIETSTNKQISPPPPKYNTNRNNTSNSSTIKKCNCFGKAVVCNTCLVKKEIHASRAGTPGYRPPEVLLKYPDQTTSVDIWAVGVIFLSILSSLYPFFKAPNDFVALAEIITIFGDRAIRKTAYILDRLVTLSQRTKPLDLRKLCVRFRNGSKLNSSGLLKKYENSDGKCEKCKNCDQFYFICLCAETTYTTEPMCNDDPFPNSAYELLYKLLEVNPHKRITADEALKHKFFENV